MNLINYKWVLIVVLLQLIVALYIGLPLSEDTQVPSHWNIKGDVDGYVGKWTGILLFPGINFLIILLMWFFPKYSARYEDREEQFNRIMPSLTLIIVLFLSLIHIYTLLLAKGLYDPNGGHIMILIGLMLIMIGVLLPRIPSNFIAGIRTPWTLSSDDVWNKTHKIGGICMILSGFVMIIIPLVFGFNKNTSIGTFILLILSIIYPVVYSLVIYKKEMNK